MSYACRYSAVFITAVLLTAAMVSMVFAFENETTGKQRACNLYPFASRPSNPPQRSCVSGNVNDVECPKIPSNIETRGRDRRASKELVAALVHVRRKMEEFDSTQHSLLVAELNDTVLPARAKLIELDEPIQPLSEALQTLQAQRKAKIKELRSAQDPMSKAEIRKQILSLTASIQNQRTNIQNAKKATAEGRSIARGNLAAATRKLEQLESKLLTRQWLITEAWPPAVPHSSPCHGSPGNPGLGCAVDIKITSSGRQRDNAKNAYMDILRDFYAQSPVRDRTGDNQVYVCNVRDEYVDVCKWSTTTNDNIHIESYLRTREGDRRITPCGV